MKIPPATEQQQAVVQALVRSLDGATAQAREEILRTIPACFYDAIIQDFDYSLAATAPSPDIVLSRLKATDNNPTVFVRLLASACARADDTMAMALLDALGPSASVHVSTSQAIMIGRGFASSPEPSAKLLDRITDANEPLRYINPKHGSRSCLSVMLDTIAVSSIKQGTDRHLSLLLENPRLPRQLFTCRGDFWSLVHAAAAARSEKGMACLVAHQDLVFAMAASHHMTPSQHQQDAVAHSTSFQDKLETLSGAIQEAAVRGNPPHEFVATLRQMLKLDPPLDPNDHFAPGPANWRIVNAIGPVQSHLGQQYQDMARPHLRRGSMDVAMDAMVFGDDPWWEECLAHISAAPALSREISDHIDFIEGELAVRIAPAAKLEHAIDDLHQSNPERASALAARLVERVPQLVHATGSVAERHDLAHFLGDTVASSKPMTAAMFRAIAMGITTEVSPDPCRAPPRM